MKNVSLLLASVAGVLVLSGCNLFWQSAEKKAGPALSSSSVVVDDVNDPVLLKIDGAPALRKGEFLEFCEQAMKANPYLASFGIVSYETAPDQIKQQLLDAIVQQKLIACWGQSQKVEDTVQYQDMFAKMAEQLRQALIAQAFEKQIFDAIIVSNEEIAEEFQKSRDQMIKDPGNVSVVGVSFDDEEKAKVFFDLVARKEEDTLSNLAKESDVEVVELGTVLLDMRAPATAPVTAGMKRALSSLKEGEYYTQVKEDGRFWVLQVIDRVKPTYLGFDEVKDQVAAQARHEKFKIVREARLNELRNAHVVDIDSSSLGGGQDPFAMLQQMLAGQGKMNPEFLEELAAAAKEEEGSLEADDSHPVAVSA